LTFAVTAVSFTSSLSVVPQWVSAGAFVCARTQGTSDNVPAVPILQE